MRKIIVSVFIAIVLPLCLQALVWAGEPLQNTEKIMYLTFDDGPHKITTPKILDALAKRGVRATFFVLGEKAEAHPEIIKRIADEGHVIGIHSYTHAYRKIYSTLDAFIKDFTATRDIILKLTGTTPDIYRFPGGSVNSFNSGIRSEAIKYLSENGYSYFDWNAGIGDAVFGKAATPKSLLKRGLETAKGESVVMLAHDTKQGTAKVVGELADKLAEKGYKFEVLSKDSIQVHF